MKNFIQRGQVITAIAPYSLTSGQGVKVGALFGVASSHAVTNSEVEVVREGVFELAAVTSESAAIGAKIYWDDTARRLTTTAGGNLLVGALARQKTGVEQTAYALLDGGIR